MYTYNDEHEIQLSVISIKRFTVHFSFNGYFINKQKKMA